MEPSKFQGKKCIKCITALHCNKDLKKQNKTLSFLLRVKGKGQGNAGLRNTFVKIQKHFRRMQGAFLA